MTTFKSARCLFVAAGLALVPAMPAAAQQAEPLLLLLHPDPHSPLSVNAERLSVRDAESTAVFEGNVEIKSANLTLRCSRLLVRYDRNAPDKNNLVYLDCQP